MTTADKNKDSTVTTKDKKDKKDSVPSPATDKKDSVKKGKDGKPIEEDELVNLLLRCWQCARVVTLMNVMV